MGASADELGLGLVETQRCLQNIAERWGVFLLLIVAEKVRGGKKGFVERRILAGSDVN